MVNRTNSDPFGLVWVDAVGGFLIYLGSEISIGQAIPGTTVDLPILGDLSRRHAIVQRMGDDYVIRPKGPVRIDGQPIEGPSALSDGNEIGLGPNVRLHFRMPSPLSNTARLDLLSHHRTQPSADGVLMLGETCLMGPGNDNHLICRHWRDQVILIPTEDGRFRFKAAHAVTVDDEPTCDTGIVDWGSRLAGEDFAFLLERL